MTNEYELLKDEILEWQSRRFTLLSIAVSVVTGILALDLLKGQPTARNSWVLLSSLLLLFLAESNTSTASCRWESRLETFKRKFNVNQVLALVYAALGTLAVLLPWRSASVNASELLNRTVLASSGVLGLALVPNFMNWYRRDYFEKHWKKVQDEEKLIGSPKTDQTKTESLFAEGSRG